jgi:hypothetical protein
LERVQQVEAADARESSHEAPVLGQAPKSSGDSHAAEVVHGRAQQRVGTRLGILAQREDMDLMPASQPLDQCEEGRRDSRRARPIDAARHNQSYPHQWAHQCA